MTKNIKGLEKGTLISEAWPLSFPRVVRKPFEGFTLISKACVPKAQKGFTLIELLVSISVIGILAAIALASFSGAQKQARDSARKSDLKQYQNSLELFANRNNGSFVSRIDSGGTVASTTLCSDLGLSSCSEDPRFDDDASFIYRYQSNGTGGGLVDATDYVVWAKLETPATTTYWVLCSNGVVGEAESGIPPLAGACPL